MAAPWLRLGWWAQRVEESPTHALVETALVLIILYIVLFKRAYDPTKRGYGGRGATGLSEREKEELISEWTPEPLFAPAAAGAGASGGTGAPGSVAGDGSGGTTAIAPSHEYVITEYETRGRNVRVRVEGDAGVKTAFVSQDFLGLGASEAVHDAAIATLNEFSLGSCGPRGFYGTTSKHLELEETLASFFGAPESITYSDAVAAIASAIPAFAKRGDLLIMDAGVNHAVQLGARLSRSKVLLFRHNDMADLERLLRGVAAADVRRDESLNQRRFIVVEGLYANYSDVAPLEQVVALARKYRWRTIVDDTCGIGVLGDTGRGTTEACGLRALDVDVLLGSLATVCGSVGGFCVGSREVVDHQRLSGSGYCFSASAPPFLCTTATMALKAVTSDADKPIQLRALARRVHAALSSRLAGVATVVGDASSPIKHIQLGEGSRAAVVDDILAGRFSPGGASGGRGGRSDEPTVVLDAIGVPPATLAELQRQRQVQDALLSEIVRRCCTAGVLVTRSHYLPGELLAPAPTLKVTVTLAHTAAEVDAMVQVVATAVRSVAGEGSASVTTEVVAGSSTERAAAGGKSSEVAAGGAGVSADGAGAPASNGGGRRSGGKGR